LTLHTKKNYKILAKYPLTEDSIAVYKRDQLFFGKKNEQEFTLETEKKANCFDGNFTGNCLAKQLYRSEQ
jgi:hypothetical protein